MPQHAAHSAPSRVVEVGCYCRWPRRDLLTCAPVAPDADVHLVSDFEWHGPVQSHSAREQAPYGPVLHDGLARELHHAAAAARHGGFAGVAMDDPTGDE